jgi:solute carrier family 25 (mitochondrial iron transporter), member 28/37
VACAQEAARAEGLVEAAAQVLRAGGPLAFFRGVRARVLYQVPAAAICWLTYETIKHALATVSIARTADSAHNHTLQTRAATQVGFT